MKLLLYITFLLAGLLLPQGWYYTNPIACFAGNPDIVQLPATTYTLHGAAFGSNGSSLTTIRWTCVTDPTGGTVSITSPTSLTTGVTGLSVWGNVLFKLYIVDANGLKDSSYARIEVRPVVNLAAPVRYNLTPSGGEYYFPNNRAQPWKGGDTLCLSVAGTFVDNIWGSVGDPTGGLSGDAGRPIVIMGPDVGTDSITTFRIDGHVQYVKFIQNPRNSKSLVWATASGRLCHDITFGDSANPKLAMHVNGASIAGAGATGWLVKTHEDTLSDGTLMPETFMGGYLMSNIYFYYCLTENTDGEGMYLGHSAPRGNDDQGPVGYYPVRMQNLRVIGCVTRNTGWDGIQTSGALNMVIHDDTVINYGIIDKGSQQAGIILGSNSTGDAYNLYIFKGTGNGLQVFTYGIIHVHDVFIDSAGYSPTQGLQQAIFQNNVLSIDTLAKADSIYGNQSAVLSTAPQKVYYYNITILHPTTSGAITSNNDAGGALADSVYNSLFCIPGASIGTWQGLYFHMNPSPTLSNLTLQTTCGTVTANAGPDQTITLPTSSATLNGTASIGATTYLWTKISGPGATTILNNTTATPTVTGLQQGVYVFQLSINSGASTSTMHVTVNPATGCNCIIFKKRFKLK